MKDRELVEYMSTFVVPTAIRDYVKASKWTELSDEVKGRFWIYNSPVDEYTQVIIPKDITSDYGRVIWEIASRIAEVESNTIRAVLDVLVNPYSDILRFRIDSPDYLTGTLPVGIASNLFDGARKALLASACSVFNKTTHHPRMSYREAEDLLNVCKMGQTEIGSYIIKIVCPLNQLEESPFAKEGFPFAREATSLLMSSSNLLLTNIEEDSIDALVDSQKETPILSSNLCDAILQMNSGFDRSSLSISALWAPVAKCGKPESPTLLNFKPEYFPKVAEVSSLLKPQNTNKTDTFVGTVEKMLGTTGSEDRRSGDVVIAVLTEGESVTARANLNYDDYHTAWQAHDGDVKYVTFTAKLVRKPGKSADVLEEITNFKLFRTQ